MGRRKLIWKKDALSIEFRTSPTASVQYRCQSWTVGFKPVKSIQNMINCPPSYFRVYSAYTLYTLHRTTLYTLYTLHRTSACTCIYIQRRLIYRIAGNFRHVKISYSFVQQSTGTKILHTIILLYMGVFLF